MSRPSPPTTASLRRRRTIAALAGIAASGCFAPEGGHTMRFELVAEPPSVVVTEATSYFLWGLVPTARIDVLEKCPYGAAAVVDGSEPAGMGVGLPTLGLWSRRSTTYYCRRPPGPPDGVP